MSSTGREEQKNHIILSSSQEVEGLSKLLIKLFGELGIEFYGAGAACHHCTKNGEIAPPIDFGAYALSQGSKSIGRY